MKKLLTFIPLAKFLFTNPKMSWLWLVVRIYVGYQWLTAGWAKIINPAWTGSSAGEALSGFIKFTLTKTTGEHPDVSSWYSWFLTHAIGPNLEFWSYVISFGEVLVGIGLILGALTGITAMFGAFMNLNFLLAGAVSINPILLVLSIGLMLSWRIAGSIGLDHYLLPGIGIPTKPGRWLLRKKK